MQANFARPSPLAGLDLPTPRLIRPGVLPTNFIDPARENGFQRLPQSTTMAGEGSAITSPWVEKFGCAINPGRAWPASFWVFRS
jgi:hypothetical protein